MTYLQAKSQSWAPCCCVWRRGKFHSIHILLASLSKSVEGRPNFNPQVIGEGIDALRSAVNETEYWTNWIFSIHRPPLLGGKEYWKVQSSERNASRDVVLNYFERADEVFYRGVASLLKANMAWQHSELREAACISLWIALDAAHSVILDRLREQGNSNPTSEDATKYLYDRFQIPGELGKFFENDYENRIRFIHPDNRFGPEARSWLLADDFYELNENLIDLFFFFSLPTFHATDRVS